VSVLFRIDPISLHPPCTPATVVRTQQVVVTAEASTPRDE
jgi:hypothetical protein